MIAVTDRRSCPEPLPARLARLSGAELVILREKDLSHDSLVSLARGCLEACPGLPLSINTDVDAARELGIRAVHLPMGVLRGADTEGMRLVGASVHSVDEAAEAERLGADYLIAGHVFGTACKPGEPRGTRFLTDVCSAVRIPVYGIGGVTPGNYAEVLACGANSAAVMSSAMASSDPGELVRSMPPVRPLFRQGDNPRRHPAAMDEGTLIRAEGFVRGLLEGDSGGHDIYHSLRVRDTAARICEAEGGDMDVVRLAALLHDVDDPKLFDPGSRNAERFMESEGIPGDVCDVVLSIIAQVSFKGADSVVPDTLEGRIVQDADRLDAIGAIGIARAFAYGGSRGRAMHVPGEAPKEGMGEVEYRANRGTTINHFHEKLLLLRDMMTTDTGRAMAEARHKYMLGFLEEFGAEWEGRRRSQQDEPVPVEVQDALPPHPPQLGGEGAAVHPQVVGHPLPVEGDGELVAPGDPRLVGQIGAHLLADAALRHLLQPPVTVRRAHRQGLDEVPDDPGVELARRRAHRGDPGDLEEHDLRRGPRDQGDLGAPAHRARVLGAHRVPGAVGGH